MSKKSGKESKVKTKLNIELNNENLRLKFVKAKKYVIKIGKKRRDVLFNKTIVFKKNSEDKELLIEAINLIKPLVEIELRIDQDSGNENNIVIATADDI